jgi:hypothetical protein
MRIAAGSLLKLYDCPERTVFSSQTVESLLMGMI